MLYPLKEKGGRLLIWVTSEEPKRRSLSSLIGQPAQSSRLCSARGAPKDISRPRVRHVR